MDKGGSWVIAPLHHAAKGVDAEEYAAKGIVEEGQRAPDNAGMVGRV